MLVDFQKAWDESFWDWYGRSYQECPLDKEWGKTWPKSGMARSGFHPMVYLLAPWERKPCSYPPWSTPMTRNRKSTKAMTPSTNNGRRSGGGNSSPPGLEQEVEISLGIVPKEMEPILHHPKVQGYIERRLWSTPRATDATKAGPNMKFGAGGTPLPAQVGGQLNPDWIEWLMGYPAGWTIAPPRPRRKRSSQVSTTDS